MNNIVLAHENQQEFHRLAAGCESEFVPKITHDRFLVDQLIQSRWRLDRFRRLETLALDQIVTGEFDETNPDSKILASLGDKPLVIITRMANAAEKSYYRAHRKLTQSRSRELRNKAKEAQVWLSNRLHDRGLDNPDYAPPASVQNEPKSPDAPKVRRMPMPWDLPGGDPVLQNEANL